MSKRVKERKTLQIKINPSDRLPRQLCMYSEVMENKTRKQQTSTQLKIAAMHTNIAPKIDFFDKQKTKRKQNKTSGYLCIIEYG